MAHLTASSKREEHDSNKIQVNTMKMEKKFKHFNYLTYLDLLFLCMTLKIKLYQKDKTMYQKCEFSKNQCFGFVFIGLKKRI